MQCGCMQGYMFKQPPRTALVEYTQGTQTQHTDPLPSLLSKNQKLQPIIRERNEARQTHLPSTVAGRSSGIVCITRPSLSATSAAPAHRRRQQSHACHTSIYSLPACLPTQPL